MRGFIKILADTAVGVVVLAGSAGAVMLVLGVMVLIEGGSSEGQPASQTFVAADNWLRQMQVNANMEPGKMFGSYGMALGTKLLAGAVACGAVFDIMYSLRTIAEVRRR